MAVKHPSFSKLKITVEDYKGNTYEGYLYRNPNKSIDAISAEYDLACIYFKASSSEVEPLNIMGNDPAVGEDVISLGAPESQSNTITFGKIRSYQAITLSNTEAYQSNVTFPVIRHTAGTDSGSSGGPLLNSDLKVVGVNYAISTGSNIGSSIPAAKIQEFLKNYVYD